MGTTGAIERTAPSPFRDHAVSARSISDLSSLSSREKLSFLDKQVWNLSSNFTNMQIYAAGNISNLMRAAKPGELAGESKKLTALLDQVAPLAGSENPAIAQPAWSASTSIISRSNILADGTLGRHMLKVPGNVAPEMLFAILDSSSHSADEALKSGAVEVAGTFMHVITKDGNEQIRADFTAKAYKFVAHSEEHPAGEAAGMFLKLMAAW